MFLVGIGEFRCFECDTLLPVVQVESGKKLSTGSQYSEKSFAFLLNVLLQGVKRWWFDGVDVGDIANSSHLTT